MSAKRPATAQAPPAAEFNLGVSPAAKTLTSVFASITRVLLIVYFLYEAYRIRTYSIRKFGPIIHEFDPWFNYRATEYLSDHGWDAFFHWFDYMTWYPLGRPVGTTIYPGMQITSVLLHRVLNHFGFAYSLIEVCCYVSPWFGSLSTALLGLITYELSSSMTATTISVMVFAILPAHLMRSIGGGYDNECVAMAAMLMVFWLWVRSLRTTGSWWIGALCGVAYGYMVAAWGGYVFVVNMVALHALVLTLADWARGKYSSRVVKSYALFWTIGTFLATRVPVVGLTPLKSLEQMLPILVLVFMAVIHYSEKPRRAAKFVVEINSVEGIRFRLRYFARAFGALVVVAAILSPTGYFGPISSRVRGLFVPHTRTGNPLVDSVAEHQPSSNSAYWSYLLQCCYFSPIGFVMLLFGGKNPRWRAASFMTSYAFVAYFFSLKMARLMILAGPVATTLSAVAVTALIEWAWRQLSALIFTPSAEEEKKAPISASPKTKAKGGPGFSEFEKMYEQNVMLRQILAVLVFALFFLSGMFTGMWQQCDDHAHGMSNPQVIFEAEVGGKRTKITDYWDAYIWLKEKTPEDARVMAWWDYGYQITGIGNRTSIADGNTWNHEHIATLGKCLTSPVKEAHSLIRHLADYVLVWTGSGHSDLAKSPHMARIGNSVYRDICPDDPLCAHFGFKDNERKQPTPMMRKSLLYNLIEAGHTPGVRVDPELFEEVYYSKFGLIRIYAVKQVSQESKAWSADPANRICDAPGSWYCNGQYPPAEPIQALLKRRRDFAQLEDFNSKRSDNKYYEEYMRRMAGAGASEEMH